MESETQVRKVIDAETEFLVSKRKSGHECELFEENVKPLKRGRYVNLLNEALKSQNDNHLKKSLHEKQRFHPRWSDTIKADNGNSNLVDDAERSDLVINKFDYEFLLHAENCTYAEVVYDFVDANDIGRSQSLFDISYAVHMESKYKIKVAREILERGISRNAEQPKKLETAYKKFLHTQ